MDIAIELWLWPLDAAPSARARYHSVLNTTEAARADRFVRAHDRDRFIAGRGRMREILGQYLDTPAGDVPLDIAQRDKPVLAHGPAFNLSHSGGQAALIVAPDQDANSLPIGIDIEAHRPVEPAMADRFFSPAEQTALAALPFNQWENGFFTCWTRKEAVIKALGQGLFADLHSFDVSLAPDAPPCVLRTDPQLPQPADWHMLHLNLGPTLPGAIAAVTRGRGLRLMCRQGALPGG